MIEYFGGLNNKLHTIEWLLEQWQIPNLNYMEYLQYTLRRKEDTSLHTKGLFNLYEERGEDLWEQ